MPRLAGGGGGIRTHETLLGPNGFQDRRFQPLTHPSDALNSNIERGAGLYTNAIRARRDLRAGIVIFLINPRA
jgi:hypothetical protein